MKNSSNTLEFPQIVKILESLTINEIGLNYLNQIEPTTSLPMVEVLLNESDEALRCLYQFGDIPTSGVHDIKRFLETAKIGSMLVPQELLKILSFTTVLRDLQTYYSNAQKGEFVFAALDKYFTKFIETKALTGEIKRCINNSGYIEDNASSELYAIRKQIIRHESGIKEKLNQILNTKRSMLTEAIITKRNDRYVVPVRVEYKNTFKGVIHDESASGNTIYIEPQVINEINSKLLSAKHEEKREIEKILYYLTSVVADNYHELTNNYNILQGLEYTYIKARFAKRYNCTLPKVNSEGRINLRKARHPLINQDEVVANDIYLGYDFDSLIITGPNTGGKTVTLKTVGLLSTMVKYGLLLPVHEHSEIAVFDDIFVDIGDEQSIEQNLSTFSSHMTNIINIVNNVGPNSLLLFDELGAGTDPKEGSALAMALIDYFIDNGAKIIATTHYAELKLYAYNKERTINASVEFDIQSLGPTYRLLIGVPGQSNALRISSKLGLREDIIDNATKYDEQNNNQISALIANLEEKSLLLNKQLDEISKKESILEAKIENYETLINEQKVNTTELIEKAQQEANLIYRKARDEADSVVKELRKIMKSGHTNVKGHEITDLRGKLNKSYTSEEEVNENIELKVGDTVYITNLQRNGELVEKLNKNAWLVQMGILSSKVPAKNIKYVSRKKVIKEKKKTMTTVKKASVGMKLDLRGIRFEEAMIKLDKYISDAMISNYSNVTIIHGHGTGAIRNGVQDYLKTSPYVKSYRYGGEGEGGNGATIVEFK